MYGVVLDGRDDHPPVGALDAHQDLLAQAGEERAHDRPGGALERILDDERRAEHAVFVADVSVDPTAQKLEQILVPAACSARRRRPGP